MTAAPASEAAREPVVASTPMAYLPVGLFGSVMGLTGLSVAWELAAHRYGAPRAIASGIGFVAIAAFVAVGIGYAVKTAFAPALTKAEFAHPVVGNLFATLLISLLLLPIVLAPLNLSLARGVWLIGAVGMFAFAWRMVDRWMSDRQQIAHATPAWVVPVVGLLDVPLAIPALHVQGLHGVMVFALAVGLFFAIPLFTLIFSRLVFEPPMPDALQPTLMILLAPFAVGTSTYVTTTGSIDLFAECLFSLTLFMLVVLGGRFRYLRQCCPFRMAWWAVSFPLAAAAIASIRVAGSWATPVGDALAWSVLAVATGVIGWLAFRTLSGIARGELRALSA